MSSSEIGKGWWTKGVKSSWRISSWSLQRGLASKRREEAKPRNLAPSRCDDVPPLLDMLKSRLDLPALPGQEVRARLAAIPEKEKSGTANQRYSIARTGKV